MSHLLWNYFHNEEVEKFRLLLQNGISNIGYTAKSHGLGAGNAQSFGSLTGSPIGFATSPKTLNKTRKVSGQLGNTSSAKGTYVSIGRAEVNSRDHAGLTILHRAASSTSETAISFAMALLEHPAIDLYAQDTENGWTALHRALYFGNITLARAIIEQDYRTPSGQFGNVTSKGASSVIKVKDREGNSPFDVYNATIARRPLQTSLISEEGASDDGSADQDSIDQEPGLDPNPSSINGDEVFAWGSSRNHGLGFKDQDDRQHPEKITLQRPDHLLFRFYREHLESLQNESLTVQKTGSFPKSVSELPTLISNRPILIQDVVLSKLHSAILTTDPESNLYMCGFGPGGRLGTGDEDTRFSYVPIDDGPLAGKKVTKVALGQNHTLAVTSDGSLLSWGSNTHSQLGYATRPALKDEEPFCASPRQIFGPLKREVIIGVAASSFHSVAHTSTSLFTWGRNKGQLGLMDSDSRSLDIQPLPRKVAASLFKASITMISAINSATIILLANHTVCVFTNYGYNIVKFPLSDGMTNYHLKTRALTTQYDSISSHITSITAGGDTIGAISSRGDLFTLTVRSIQTNSSSSTTNPAKIKESLTTPERVWSLRKGHWDGIRSAGITENGSVIVCTQAGAVWRRVKRANVKDTFTGGYNRKDFKFQRIPGLTKVAAVRSTYFGVYAAIRSDCDITRSQISVDDPNLWGDISRLLVIRDMETSQLTKGEDTEKPRFWTPALPVRLFNPVKKAVLCSPDLEADVSRHLLGKRINGSHNFELATTTSDVRIPVHGFILARSPVLRKLLDEFRCHGRAAIQDVLTLQEHAAAARAHDKPRPTLLLQGVDFITLVNLVLYLYTDTVVDVWNFTRFSPTMAFRYRQIRVELMKTAGYLRLGRLESAVRLMTEPEKSMNLDFDLAIQDPTYFDDGDAIIELDDEAEMLVHSAMLCRRCPFFDGLFNGRAGGQWLAGRREDRSEPVRIDLKHIQPDVFQLVLRYVYADVGTTLFDDVVCADIDEFSDIVMDVMAVSNELMLDRLSQICQGVIGRFVNTRNVCHLLNAIAPCSVIRFKDAALEYLCLQLESMLENHLLNDLDEDLLLELDEVVRANQLNCLPVAKSDKAWKDLLGRHPSLSDDIQEERQRRLREMTFRASLKDEESRLSSSYRARIGSVEDMVHASPSDKSRRKSRGGRNAPFSPDITPRDSTTDLMFDMDDDDEEDDDALSIGSPRSPVIKARSVIRSNERSYPGGSMPRFDELDSGTISNEHALPLFPRKPGPGIQSTIETTSATPTKKWSAPSLPSSKLDMREIMAQASSSRPSVLSIRLSAERAKEEKDNRFSVPKLSQKERKKQQQALYQSTVKKESPSNVDSKISSPWRIAERGPKTSLKEVLQEPGSSPLVGPAKTFASPVSAQPLTPRRTASPDTRFSGQSRNASKSRVEPSKSKSQASTSKPSPIVPQSKSYISPAAQAEPSLQLSMADIIGQQRREVEVIKEAVAKRSLQEIQEEQAFQEWWDQESRRAQEAEAARTKASTTGSGRDVKGSGGRGKGGRGRGGKGRGDAHARGRGKGKEKGSSSTS